MYYGKIPDRRRRFIDFVGEGFMLGLASSSAFYFVSGLCRSPSGGRGRLAGGAQIVLANAPRFAGWLGGYSAMFFCVETAVSRARRREDDWNFITAGSASMGLSEMRRGARAAALSALTGAAVSMVPLGLFWFVSGMYLDSRSERRQARRLHRNSS